MTGTFIDEYIYVADMEKAVEMIPEIMRLCAG